MPAFDAEVRATGRGSHALVVPRSVVAELASKRVLVRIGPESFEATLGAYGGRTFLGLRKSLLTALGAVAGDEVHVDLEPAAPAEEAETEAAPLTCTELEAFPRRRPAAAGRVGSPARGTPRGVRPLDQRRR